jgi:hypothetical protein
VVLGQCSNVVIETVLVNGELEHHVLLLLNFVHVVLKLHVKLNFEFSVLSSATVGRLVRLVVLLTELGFPF